jgi:hypothetical protein
MAKSFSRRNVGGTIFSKPAGAFESVEAWLEAKAPSNSIVFDNSMNLITVGLPIIDAQLVDGAYFKAAKSVPATSTIVLDHFTRKGIISKAELEPVHYPSLIVFDLTKAKHQPKTIGTASSTSAKMKKDEDKS